jgi:uncharacterized protein (TIGR03790 family)
LSPEVQAKAGETGAAVDSELSMLLAPHSLQRWLPNPFLKKYDRYPRIKEIRDSTLLVARLDGPTPEIAKRLVDDAVEVEEKGLTGTFYIDARGLSAKTNYYGMYDRHLRNLAEILAKQTTFPVVFDDRPGLFREKSCHKAALYCGWYSLLAIRILSTGGKERSASMWPAPKPPPSVSREARSGANACWRKE